MESSIYHRKDHFRQIIYRITGPNFKAKNNDIRLIVRKLKAYLKRDQISSDQIDYQLIKRYLITDRDYEYLDDLIFITTELKYGKKYRKQLPVLTKDNFEYLIKYCDIFADHWDQICQSYYGQQRSYSYNMVIRRLLALLNLPKFLIYFPEIRTPPKVMECDQMWVHACQIIGWPIPPQTLLDWAQIIISKHWRRILSQRRCQRLRIGQELVLLPNIGIEYQLAMDRFNQLSN